jgi:molybdenum transport protein
MDLLKEDVGYVDLTTVGLGIDNEFGKIIFKAKGDIILSGLSHVEKICNQSSLKYKIYKRDKQKVLAGEVILICEGEAGALHKMWKISQNILEYCSGIASYTNRLVQKVQIHNPNIVVATTRKNFPGAKELMIQAVIDGGGVVHRMGLYDSILIFPEHLEFISDKQELEKKFQELKRQHIEKKITVEVDSYEDASYFGSLGVDILQCEKMDDKSLQQCINLKKQYPNLLISATGGVNETNIEHYAKLGVDLIVTSSPYHAKPADIKVVIEADKSWKIIDSI